jgi:hypothetical protein
VVLDVGAVATRTRPAIICCPMMSKLMVSVGKAAAEKQTAIVLFIDE